MRTLDVAARQRYLWGVLRILSVLAALGPAILGLTFAPIPGGAWSGPVLAVLLALPVAWAYRRATTAVVLGVGLGALAAHLAGNAAQQRARLQDDAAKTFDLTSGSIPRGSQGWATVRGYLHAEWVLDEYATADGQRPNQSERAPVVLVPMLGIREGTVGPDDTVVVARVRAGTQNRTARVELEGALGPLHPQLLDTVVRAAGGTGAGRLHGLMLDTLDRTEPRDVWVATGLSILCGLLGAASLLFAGFDGRPAARDGDTLDKQERGRKKN